MMLPTEPDVILAASRNICHPAWALASSPSDHRSAVGGRGGDDGGAQGRRTQGSGRPVQAPPTSDAEATIQRLIAQADGYARTIMDLAFAAWSGTQRCADCRFANAVRQGVSAYCGRCLHTLDLLTAAGFGDQLREWAG